MAPVDEAEAMALDAARDTGCESCGEADHEYMTCPFGHPRGCSCPECRADELISEGEW